MTEPSYAVARLEEGDAASLIDCFRRCYGDTYPADDFADVDRLTHRIRRGTLRSVIVRAADGSPDGTIVGHTGLTILRPDARACEAGNTIVDPAHRGHGLLALLAKALADLVREEGFVAYLHYPTTAHEIMQKASVRGGGVETGVMLDYIPAETDYRSIDRVDGRLAATVVYQPFAPAPKRTVFVPQPWRETLVDLYSAAGLERDVEIASDRVPAVPKGSDPSGTLAMRTVAETIVNARRSLLRIEARRVGDDFHDWVQHAMAQNPAAITHVDLMLDDAGIGAAVSALAQLGFVFCALLPEVAHTDVLRFQHISAPTHRSFAPALANAGARHLLELMKARA